ncbi:MAG: DUF5672 family protein [Bacillota bacterium]|nr:DUF5672 family protein [Bacillota bacterium]
MLLNHDQIGIVIPIYKIDPSPEEEISIYRAFQVLNKYRFYFVAPQGLDLMNYEKFFTYSPKVIRFSDSYFNNGLEGYNQLMLSRKFYAEFSSCKYILIYQPDSYVFRDDLMEWCRKGYDYLGAPWTENKNGKIRLNGVGNGGFSLRKVESFLNIFDLCEIRTICETSRIKRKFYKYLNKIIRWRIKLLHLANGRKAIFYREITFNEDGIWGISAPQITRKFRTAPQETTVKFSFDTDPDFLYQLNQRQLPFGCHAWAKVDPAFWEKHISDS